MYTAFLDTLAKIAKLLDEAAKIGGDEDGMPTPYLYGRVGVRLDGQDVGYFEFEDEWVIYHEGSK